MLSAADAADHAAAACAPVLFLDTCMLLDVIRAPTRTSIAVHDISAVGELLQRAGHEPESLLTIVLCEQVLKEFQEHSKEVSKETERILKSDSKTHQEIVTRMNAFPGIAHGIAAVDVADQGFPAHSRGIAERLAAAAIIVENHDEEKVAAFNRVKSFAPPAARGKQSANDCLIIETYLRVARELEGKGVAFNRVFATSNKDDFHQGHSTLHPQLQSEFAAVALTFAPNWSASRHELDRDDTWTA